MEESVFDLSPEQLDRLLSIGTDGADLNEDEEHDEQTNGQGTGHLDKGPSSAKCRLEVTDTSLAEVVEQTGGWMGPYKLQSVLGEGGMGIVYLAEQKRPIKRRVALKVIKPGMDSKRVIARFEAERQVLALLDHPNIAHVYDAGTTQSGRPYFVMEYVEGLPITEHCDRHKLTIEDRLNLFQQICQAVHHAHQKGIIHRDIKPSNILVSLENNQPIPKIIDFGVAKAIAQPLTERTHQTEESQLLGTPEYMSPEQADMVNEDIDTRSDVYSLGVLLYVLLTGVLPFDPKILRESGIDNIRKTIRETDPKTPSTRLTSLGEDAEKVAEHRSTEISTLTKHLKKELEWIPLKAMRKERAERYRSASELADDIENYLHGAPLIAGPPTTIYRLKKFVRRNAVLSAAVLAVAVTVVVGLIGITVMYFRVGDALSKERLARFEAQAVSDLWTKRILGNDDFSQGSPLNLEDALDKQTELLKKRSWDQPTVEASIRHTLGDAYLNIGKPEKADEHLERAYKLREQHLGPEHDATNKTANMLCWAYWQQGRLVDAHELWGRQVEIIRRTRGDQSGWVLLFMYNIGQVYLTSGRYEEAEVQLKKVLGLCGRSQSARRNYVLRMASLCLGKTFKAQGRYEEAEDILQRLLEEQRQQLGETNEHTQESLKSLIKLYEAWDKPKEADKWRSKLEKHQGQPL